METRIFAQSEMLGLDYFCEETALWYLDDGIDRDAYCEKVCACVNHALPGSYQWVPDRSEIIVNVDEAEELDLEDFFALTEKYAEEVAQEWES